MAGPYKVNPSEEVVREEIAVDIILWCNEFAKTLYDRHEPAAAAAVNLMGKHLAKQILEGRCSTYGLPFSSP